MNRDLARSRRLQRIADFALSVTAALLGVVLLGAAVFHLLAPAAVSTAPFEPGAPAVVDGLYGRVQMSLGPGASQQRATASSRGDRPRTAFNGPARRATFPNASAPHGPARPVARMTAPVPARPSATPPASRPPVAAPASHASIAATSSRHGATFYRKPATGRLKARLVRASGLPAASLRAGTLQTGPVRANPLQALAVSRRRSTRLAARPPRGYDPRPTLVRISVEAVPAVPAGTTPVRGRLPRPSASARASASTAAPTPAALDPFQNTALPSL